MVEITSIEHIFCWGTLDFGILWQLTLAIHPNNVWLGSIGQPHIYQDLGSPSTAAIINSIT